MRDIRQKVGGEEEEEERLSKLKYSVLGCMELPATTKKTDKISSDVQEGQECWWVTACCRSFLDWRDVSCLSQVTENIISRQTLQGEHQIIYIQSCNTDYWLTPGFPSGSGLYSQSCTDFIFTFFYTSFTLYFYFLFYFLLLLYLLSYYRSKNHTTWLQHDRGKVCDTETFSTPYTQQPTRWAMSASVKSSAL